MKNNSAPYLVKRINTIYIVCLLFATSLHAATQAEIDNMRINALAWLISNQQGDGSWKGAAGSEVHTTALALKVLSNAGITGVPYSRGLAWLANTEAHSVDSLSRQIIAMADAGMDTSTKLDQLISWRNNKLAWGAYDRYNTSFPDTALASNAIRIDSLSYIFEQVNLESALCELLQGQKSSGAGVAGSWGYMPIIDATLLPSDTGAILPTAVNLLELAAYSDLGYVNHSCGVFVYNISSVLNDGIDWLLLQGNTGGGYMDPGSDDGNGGTSSSLDTALVYLALEKIRPSAIELIIAQDYLVNRQGQNGSWLEDGLSTALVAMTLPPSVLPDTDTDGIPDSVEAVLGTDPAIFDSRIYASGNGMGVVWTQVPSKYTASVNQSSTFALDLQSLPNTAGSPSGIPDGSGGTILTGVYQTDGYNPGGTYSFGYLLPYMISDATIQTSYVNTTSSIETVNISFNHQYGINDAYSLPESLLPVQDSYDKTLNPGETLTIPVRIYTGGRPDGSYLIDNLVVVLPRSIPYNIPPGSNCPCPDTINSFNIFFLSRVVNAIPYETTAYDPLELYISHGALPPGYTYNATTGVISGASNISGTYDFTLSTLDDVSSFSGQIIINTPPSLTSPGPMNNVVGDSILLTILATDNDNDYLTFSAANLPVGLVINPVTGEISGTIPPNTSGTYNTTVTVTDSHDYANVNFTWDITDHLSGDVNDDGQLSAADILLMQRYLLGLATLAPDAITRGDIYPAGSGDGAITLSDLILLRQAVF